MVANTSMISAAEWHCIPTDWKEVIEIRIMLLPNLIEAIYIKEMNSEKESYPYDAAIQGNDGMVRLCGTPFSLLKFNSEDKMLISRKTSAVTRPYTYIFDLVKQPISADFSL